MANHNFSIDNFMSSHNSLGISESEQMYLITIARLLENGQTEPIPLSSIAQKMSILPVSVNQMVRKLEGEGLLHYLPYKGVELTNRGKEVAFRTLRNRRLWEVFLVNHLQVPYEEADAMACAMEHITPEDIALRLADYLDNPVSNPTGQLIPILEAEGFMVNLVRLTEVEAGREVHIVKIEGQQAATRFLNEEGLHPGSSIVLEAIGAQGSCLVKSEAGYLELSAKLANSIFISPLDHTNNSQSKNNH